MTALAIARHVSEYFRQCADPQSRVGRLVFPLGVGLVTLSAAVSRSLALNPESLWYDDLAWVALIRTENVAAMLRAPTHAPPGFLMLLRLFGALFRDPEWSVQLVPFLCGVAAIPIMALGVRRLTGSRALGLLAAALAALNPLLAHYSVFVKQYSLDFLMTAVLLLAGASLLVDHEIRPREVAWLTLFSGFALLFSVGSVFVSAPLVGVVIIRALWVRRDGRRAILLTAGAFALTMIGGFLLFRSRAFGLSDASIRQNLFGRSYFLSAMWTFLSTDWRRIVELSLPSWRETSPWSPDPVSWTIPFVVLGFFWLFVRRSTRAIGCVVLGFAVMYFFFTYTQLYRLTSDRRSLFAFPIFIDLAVMGVHLLTAGFPRSETIRLVAGAGVVAFAVISPIRVQYWGVNDVRLIRTVAASSPGDGLVLSPAAVYLAAYYGPWPIGVAARGATRNSESVGIVRNLTAISLTQGYVRRFLGRVRPNRVWYVAFRTGQKDDAMVLEAMAERGYVVEAVNQTTRGRLYLGVLH